MPKLDPETMKNIWQAYKGARFEILVQVVESALNIDALAPRIARELMPLTRLGERDPDRLAMLAVQSLQQPTPSPPTRTLH